MIPTTTTINLVFLLFTLITISSAYYYSNNYNNHYNGFSRRWMNSRSGDWNSGYDNDIDNHDAWTDTDSYSGSKYINHDNNDIDGWESWDSTPSYYSSSNSNSGSSKEGFFGLTKGWTGKKSSNFKIPYRSFKFGFPIPVLPKVKFAFGLGWKWPTSNSGSGGGGGWK